MHRRIRNSFARIVVYAALSHLTSSCVLIPIPYVPESDVTIQMEGELPSDKMILDFTSGGIVDEIAEVIESETPRIEIVNAQDHKDVIFPGQDQWVSSFFKEGNCRRIAQELNVDYAILITGLHRIELQSLGRGLEFGGAGYSQAKETLSAAIIDMRSALLLSKLKVDTEDSFAELGFVVIPSVFPLGGKYSVQHVIGKEIASALLARSDKSKLRIVVFGLVDSGDNSIAVVKKHLLRKRLASGDEAYEIKRGLADLDDYQPFEALAEQPFSIGQ
jgi:hypothetical protein